MLFILYKSNLHIYNYIAEKPGGKSLCGLKKGVFSEENVIFTAINWVFRNMQSAVIQCNIDQKCFGSFWVIGV